MKKDIIKPLTFNELHQAYEKCICTGMRLFGGGVTLQYEYPEIAIGIFEIGQEEIGKSFSVLAAFKYGKSKLHWAEFWKSWRDHNKKVARSFFYEWISPKRLLVGKNIEQSLDGKSRKGNVPKEKESAFYIHYDKDNNIFKSPEEMIDLEEVFNRASSMMSHLVTALSIKLTLDEGDKEWNYNMFCEIPHRIMSTYTRQEDMIAILNEFSSRSNKHDILINRLKEQLVEQHRWIGNMVEKYRK